jgi:predicted nucleic acid-binding protein
VTVFPFDLMAAKTTAALRAILEQAGTPLGPLDTLIAGTTLTHQAVLSLTTPVSSAGFPTCAWKIGISQ